MIGTPAADMMCLDVLIRTASKVKHAPPVVSLRRRTINNQKRALPLNAHVAYSGGRRSDEDDAFLFARLCKLGVLRQKAVTWVHGLEDRTAAVGVVSLSA